APAPHLHHQPRLLIPLGLQLQVTPTRPPPGCILPGGRFARGNQHSDRPLSQAQPRCDPFSPANCYFGFSGAPTSATPVPRSVAGAASHPFTVRSAEALARRPPAGLKATPQTSSACPRSVRASRPDCASQTFTVRSPEALARRRPSGLKATPQTSSA